MTFAAGGRLVATERGQFFVRDSGPTDGVPLVFLHGWPESSLCWSGVLSELAWTPRRYIRPDLRGLGDSERTPGWKPYKKQELARDMVALLDALGVERFDLIGHDWGGSVAQEMCQLAAARIRRLVLAAIPIINNFTGYERGRYAEFLRGNQLDWYQGFQRIPGLAEGLIRGREDLWIRTFMVSSRSDRPIPGDHIQEYIRCYALPGTAASAASYYRALPFDLRAWRKLLDWKNPVPALILHGTRDVTILPEYFEGAQECFEADARIVALDAGHFIPEEVPDLMARELQSFLA